MLIHQQKAEVPHEVSTLIDVIGWFFFDFIILGYVEDHTSGLSFSIPHSTTWRLFIEVSNILKINTIGAIIMQHYLVSKEGK